MVFYSISSDPNAVHYVYLFKCDENGNIEGDKYHD